MVGQVYQEVVNNPSKVKCTEVFKMKSNKVTPVFCEPSNKLLPPSMNTKTETKFIIKTDLSSSGKIGLNVNTNVHLRPKKRLDFKDYVNAILFFLLFAQVLFTHLQTQQLKADIEATQEYVNSLRQSLGKASVLFEQVQERLQELENTFAQNIVLKNEGHSLTKREVEVQTTYLNCSNTARETRSISRGKHSHCKNRNGSRCRCYQTSGPLSVHLRGALPEISVRDGGIIAPWYIDKSSSGLFHLADGVIGEGQGIIEIIEEGLYFIHAQMYYLTSSALNSYALNVQISGGRAREDTVLAVCSAEAATNKLSELSCYTGMVRYLRRGDRIYATQRERNRRIIFRDNKSFLGLTLLNSPRGFVQ